MRDKELQNLIKAIENLGWGKKFERYFNGEHTVHFLNSSKELLTIHYNEIPDEELVERLEEEN